MNLPAEQLTEVDLAKTENIFRLQQEMESLPEQMHIDPPVKHYFAPGVYAREMIIPKGCLIVGKIHKHEHLNIISYGHVSVSTYEGVKSYMGPLTMTSPKGVKRVVYAHEETMWTTIHLTEETDLEKIEQEIIAKSYDDIPELELVKKMKELGEDK
jgi:hypothetical protein